MLLEEMDVYQRAIKLANDIYFTVQNWSRFDLNTLGRQLVNAADSVPSNLAEGYGRFSGAENRKFIMYAKGSLYEVRVQLIMAFTRNLVADDTYQKLISHANDLAPMLLGYLKSVSKSYKH